jgi:serpin B
MRTPYSLIRVVSLLLVSMLAATQGSFPQSVSSAEASAAAQAVNAFTMDLYSRLAERDAENIVVSPFSVSVALSMTMAGARGETADQMNRVLHTDTLGDQVHDAFRSLFEEVTHVRSEDSVGQTSLANGLWIQETLPVLPEYIDLVRIDYDADIEKVDFADDAKREVARQQINAWVENHTSDKIKEILHPEDMSRLTAMILGNAIYFCGNWEYSFRKENTETDSFHTPSGELVKVPMMSLTTNTGGFGYYETPQFQELELPYRGDVFSMVILLPRKPDGLTRLEDSLKAGRLSAWLSPLGSTDHVSLRVRLPRFKTGQRYSLVPALADMGMTLPLGAGADFSGICGKGCPIYIDRVIHQTYLDVNEVGTEAAAATVILMRLSMSPRSVDFYANRPFFFVIIHKPTGCLLFVGRITNPLQ